MNKHVRTMLHQFLTCGLSYLHGQTRTDGHTKAHGLIEENMIPASRHIAGTQVIKVLQVF